MSRADRYAIHADDVAMGDDGTPEDLQLTTSLEDTGRRPVRQIRQREAE